MGWTPHEKRKASGPRRGLLSRLPSYSTTEKALKILLLVYTSVVLASATFLVEAAGQRFSQSNTCLENATQLTDGLAGNEPYNVLMARLVLAQCGLAPDVIDRLEAASRLHHMQSPETDGFLHLGSGKLCLSNRFPFILASGRPEFSITDQRYLGEGVWPEMGDHLLYVNENDSKGSTRTIRANNENPRRTGVQNSDGSEPGRLARDCIDISLTIAAEGEPAQEQPPTPSPVQTPTLTHAPNPADADTAETGAESPPPEEPNPKRGTLHQSQCFRVLGTPTMPRVNEYWVEIRRVSPSACFQGADMATPGFFQRVIGFFLWSGEPNAR